MLTVSLLGACGGGGGGGGSGGGSASTESALSISASPNPVSAGNASTINWSAANVGACIADGAWQGQKSNQAGSESTGRLYASSTYFLNCIRNAGDTIEAKVRVQVDVQPGHVPLEREVIAQGVGAWAKAFADLDGDGKLDVIVSGGPTLTPGVYWYGSKSGYKQRNTLSPRGGGEDLHIADVDGDTLPDVIAAGLKDDPVNGLTGQSRLAWFKNPGPGAATNLWVENVVSGDFVAHELLSADFNNDGKRDIIAQHSTTEAVVVFLQGAAGAPWTPVAFAAAPLGIAVADVDADGLPDVIGHGYWLKNPGAGLTTAANWTRHVFDATIPGAVALGGSTIVAAELDGPNTGLDIVIAPSELDQNQRGNIARYRFSGDPRIAGNWSKTVWLTDAVNVHAMRVVDFDKNGRKDVVFAEMFTPGIPFVRVGVFLNRGAGNVDLQIVSGTGSHNLDVGNVDGRMAIVTSNQEVSDSGDKGALSIIYGPQN